MLNLRQKDGNYADATCATCQGEGQIPIWMQLQRFTGLAYRRQRLAAKKTEIQRAEAWGCPVDMVRDLEAGLIRPPFLFPLDPVVETAKEHNLERFVDQFVVVKPARRRRG